MYIDPQLLETVYHPKPGQNRVQVDRTYEYRDDPSKPNPWKSFLDEWRRRRQDKPTADPPEYPPPPVQPPPPPPDPIDPNGPLNPLMGPGGGYPFNPYSGGYSNAGLTPGSRAFMQAMMAQRTNPYRIRY